MSQTRTIQNSFNSGELSPFVSSRVDQARYFNSCKTLENFVPLVPGGVRRRGGFMYAGPAKALCYLTPFVYSAADSYVLEFSNNHIRFWKYDANGNPAQVVDGGGVAIEVDTTYTLAQLPSIVVKQSADVLFIVHPAHAPAKLSRYSEIVWTLVTTTFIPPATYEPKTDLATTLYASVATGDDRTFTAGGNVFLLGDVGRHIIGYDGARAIITTYVAANQIKGDILDGSFPLIGDPYDSGEWWLDGTPVLACFPDKAGPVGAIVFVRCGTVPYVNEDAFRTGDVGKYIHLLGGTIKITHFYSALWVKGEIISFLDNWTTTIPYALAGAWTMESETWTAARGYPSTLTLGEQRVFYGGAAAEPDVVRATTIGDYYGFPPGTNDDDALNYMLASEEVNIMRWMHFWEGLVCGTLGSEFIIRGPSDTTLTPTGASQKSLSVYGSEPISPDRVGKSLLFVERAGRKIRALVYDFMSDSYMALDLTAFAEHLTLTYGFTRSTYHKTPYQLVWYLRSDGTLCALCYSKENEVLGWSRHSTRVAAGVSVINSMCCVPNPVKKRDDLWVSIARVLNCGGQPSTVYTIEVLDFDYHLDCSKKWAGGASAAPNGFEHLAGESCMIRGKASTDGKWRLYPAQVVTGAGAVAGLSPTVTEAEVGISYTATMVTQRLEMPGAPTLQGRIKGFGPMTLRCYDTPCLSIAGVYYKGGPEGGMAAGYTPSAVFVIPLTTEAIAVPLDDGEIEIASTGYDKFGRVTIAQALPVETTVVLLTARVDVGE